MGRLKNTQTKLFPTFKDMKLPVVENKRKPPSARKSLFQKFEEPSHKQMNNKTQVSETFCIICHNCKEEI